ncbi:MAG TPA: hypothetical protein PLN69_11605 [bacterium]|nr:hypothetical protein [bacterium]
MKKSLILLFFAVLIITMGGCSSNNDGKSPEECGLLLGTEIDDWAKAAKQTSDGGFIIAGAKAMGNISGKMWVLKLDADKNIQWEKTFSQEGRIESATDIIETPGGFIVCGYSQHAETGNMDMRIMKLDLAGGQVWSEDFGAQADEAAFSIDKTGDGNYVVAGYANGEGKIKGDIWVLIIDDDGELIRESILERNELEIASKIVATSDGGFIVSAGRINNDDGTFNDLLIKLDENLAELWRGTYGDKNDSANTVIEIPGGKYVVAGGKITLVDSMGKAEWQKSYAGVIMGVRQTQDGGFIIAEQSEFWGPGAMDILVLKLNPNGEKVWAKAFGGKQNDSPLSIEITNDGGYIVAGQTMSAGAGSRDLWVLRLDQKGECVW